MRFRQLFSADSFTYTYLVADDQGEAFMIDPVFTKFDLYCQLLDELQLTLRYAIDTHTHADHITATGKLRAHTGCEIVMAHTATAEGVTKHIKHQDVITCGQLVLTALATPGHTDDSFCFALPDRVFTGDTLFIRGTGRTDFQSGDAGIQYDAITEHLLTLPDDTRVYPGHDYQGMTVSTIGEEKHFNPRLQVADKAAYIKLMDNLNLPKPKLIDVALPANLKCGLDMQ